MLKKPFFSIVIPTYNRASDLRFALFCILRQKFRDFEIVISDNCSTDNTQEIVRQFDDKRIRYTRTDKTLWNSFNIKRGVGFARGKYVFLHSDDDFLLYKSSLSVVFKEIVHHGSGFIRINYLSLSLNKRHIFTYKLRKPFTKNTYLKKALDNETILSFIRDCDPYFISGIVIKNEFPESIKVVDSDPAPWIHLLFYVTKRFGAGFIIKQHLVAQWSRRETLKNQVHHIFSLINGKLRSEQYLHAVRSYINPIAYKNFLRSELSVLYVACFPMIKSKVGNMGLLQLSRRVVSLVPEFKMAVSYWLYIVFALVIPEYVWRFLRLIYLWIYAKFSRVNNDHIIIGAMKKLEKEFIAFKLTHDGTSSRVFRL